MRKKYKVANVSLNRQTKKNSSLRDVKNKRSNFSQLGTFKTSLNARQKCSCLLPNFYNSDFATKKKSKKRQLIVISKRIKLRAGLLSCGKKNIEQEKGEQR